MTAFGVLMFPTAYAVAMMSRLNSTLPVTETAKTRGCSRIAMPSTHIPRPSTSRLVFVATRSPAVRRHRRPHPYRRVPL